MATKGNSALHKGIPILKDAFVVIVKTEWNEAIVNVLEAGCINVLNEHGVRYETLVVPGAFEIPFAIQCFAKESTKKADAFITLGAVIKGDTPHFDYVCQGVTDGVMTLNLQLNVPVIYSVLTVNTEEQAHERMGGIHGHKGEEGAIAAIKMIALKRSIK